MWDVLTISYLLLLEVTASLILPAKLLGNVTTSHIWRETGSLRFKTTHFALKLTVRLKDDIRGMEKLLVAVMVEEDIGR